MLRGAMIVSELRDHGVRGVCPLCGSDRTGDPLRLDVFTNLRCADCGFRYVREVLPDDRLDAFYRAGYGNERMRLGQIVNAGVNLWLFRDLLGTAARGRLIDVGTGYGFFPDAARRTLGLEVAGVELSAAEATYARDRLGLAIAPSLDAVGPGERFDIVTAFEVIEHVPEPAAFAAALAAMVRPGGYLLLATDNFESPAARALGAGFPKWIPHQHVSCFAPASLRRLIAGLDGFEVVGERSYTPWELQARRLAIALSGGRIGRFEYRYGPALERDDSGTYRLPRLRRHANRLWARLTARRGLGGAMMYALARRAA